MSEIYVSKEHFTGKPDCSGRTDKEARVYDLLDQLHIPYEGVDHDVAPTIEACRAVVGTRYSRLQESVFAQPTKDHIFSSSHARRKKVFHKRPVCAAGHLTPFLCGAGIYGAVSGTYTRFSQCARTYE